MAVASDLDSILPDDEQRRLDEEILDRHLVQLREHFDSVQIFATRHRGDEEGTESRARGAGDWYARYGLARKWVLRQEEPD